MADLDYDHYDGSYQAAVSGHRFGRYAHLGGAALSLALVIGGGLWGYQLAVRDISGIPVIRAARKPNIRACRSMRWRRPVWRCLCLKH